MAFDYIIKVGDTLPTMVATLRDANGAPVDLTGSSIRFLVRPKGGAAEDFNASILDAEAGQVSYTPTSNEWDTAGVYEGEFEVTFSGGAKLTVPTKGYIRIKVYADLG